MLCCYPITFVTRSDRVFEETLFFGFLFNLLEQLQIQWF